MSLLKVRRSAMLARYCLGSDTFLFARVVQTRLNIQEIAMPSAAPVAAPAAAAEDAPLEVRRLSLLRP